MKRLIYISFITLLMIVGVGCDDRLKDLNTDKRNPADVDPTSLFANGLRETHDMMATINVNEGPFNLYAQYFAQTTYPEESQYNMVSRSIPHTFWINGYRDALAQFEASRVRIQAQLEEGNSGIPDEVLQNRLAAIEVMMVYVYHTLVDAFGDIPYTEALDPEKINPVYDDAATVYASIIERLNTAITNIDPSAEGFPSVQDPMYNGDMGHWLLFANSLKLRLGMRLAEVNQAKSVEMVNEALAAGVFKSNADNAALVYGGSAPNTNPIYEDLVLSGRHDFLAANTLVDVMNDLEDPRREVYFDQNLGEGVYEGGIYGTANNFSAYTQLGAALHEPDFAGILLSYAEVEFLKAEAAARGGYNVVGSAEMHYNQGIMASFDQWGLSEAAAMAYIAKPEVNYATAPGAWNVKIGKQMWLALYAQGFEAWTTWRRLDFGILVPPAGMTADDIPKRFIYPIEEATLNGPNYDAAGAKLTGGDDASSRIFWDVQ